MSTLHVYVSSDFHFPWSWTINTFFPENGYKREFYEYLLSPLFLRQLGNGILIHCGDLVWDGRLLGYRNFGRCQSVPCLLEVLHHFSKHKNPPIFIPGNHCWWSGIVRTVNGIMLFDEKAFIKWAKECDDLPPNAAGETLTQIHKIKHLKPMVDHYIHLGPGLLMEDGEMIWLTIDEKRGIELLLLCCETCEKLLMLLQAGKVKFPDILPCPLKGTLLAVCVHSPPIGRNNGEFLINEMNRISKRFQLTFTKIFFGHIHGPFTSRWWHQMRQVCQEFSEYHPVLPEHNNFRPIDATPLLLDFWVDYSLEEQVEVGEVERQLEEAEAPESVRSKY